MPCRPGARSPPLTLLRPCLPCSNKMQLQGQHLDLPINLTLKKCRADGQRGPCTPQPLPDQQLSIGGCIYGNFLVQ